MLSPRVAWFAHPPFHLHWLTIMQINKTTDSLENFLHWISSVTHSQNCPSVDTEDIRRDILDLWPLQDCAQFQGLTIFILYQWRRTPHTLRVYSLARPPTSETRWSTCKQCIPIQAVLQACNQCIESPQGAGGGVCRMQRQRGLYRLARPERERWANVRHWRHSCTIFPVHTKHRLKCTMQPQLVSFLLTL